MSIQVLQQWKTLFESLEIFAHGIHTSDSASLEVLIRSS